MTFSLKLLGGVSLAGEQGPLAGPAVQRHRLALLALLAAAHPRAVSRDKLMAWLWPERDEGARGLLNQAVHVLRRTLGDGAILSVGDELRLDPAAVWCDVIGFEEAASAGEAERAAGHYAGPFLDGFFLSDAPEFERWVERERERLAESYARVLETLAERADADGDRRRSAEWWKRRVEHDPYDSRVVARLMLALEAAGNRAGALVQAETHQRLLKDDLGLEPSPEVETLARRLRSSRTPAGSWLPAAAPGPAAPAEVTAAMSSVPPAAALPPPAQAFEDRPAPRRSIRYGMAAALAGALVIAAVWLTSARVAARAGRAAVPVDSIAQAVARELTRRERGDTAVRLPEHRTRSIPAYELYLRGNDPVLLRSDTGARRGLEYFQRAVALDTTYAAAWAGLARMTLRTNLNGDPSGVARAEVAARKAIALDDSLADAHGSLALVRMMHHDLAGTESHLHHAVALAPRTGRYLEWLVRLYVWMGRPAEALDAARRALAIDPLSTSGHAELARALLAAGQPDEALTELEAIAGVDPPLLRVSTITAQAYAQKKMWPEAIAVMEKHGQSSEAARGFRGYLLGRAGRRAEADSVIRMLLARPPARDERELELALVYAGLGRLDQVTAWLERALDNRTLRPFTETAPLLPDLLEEHRRDPRVAALLRRLGLQSR